MLNGLAGVVPIQASNDPHRLGLEDGEISVEFRGPDGRGWAAALKASQAAQFLEDAQSIVAQERAELKERMRERLDAVFKEAFADRDEAVGEFADWYYGFFTAPDLVVSGLWSGAKNIPSRDGDVIMQAVKRAVETRLRDKYIELVLEPQIRNPVVVSGVDQMIRDTHNDYLQSLRRLDARFIDFIVANARYAKPISDDGRLRLTLDWNAESYRAPMEYADEGLQFGAGGIALVLGGTLMGEVLLEVMGGVLAGIVAEATVAANFAAVGAVLGSEVPLIGNFVGAVVGLAAHGIATWVREGVGRDDFTAKTDASVDATITRWTKLIDGKASQLIDRWINETQRLIVSSELEQKLGS